MYINNYGMMKRLLCRGEILYGTYGRNEKPTIIRPSRSDGKVVGAMFCRKVGWISLDWKDGFQEKCTKHNLKFMDPDNVVMMPRKLSGQKGHKFATYGRFSVNGMWESPGGKEFPVELPVTFDTIKDIYDRIVQYRSVSALDRVLMVMRDEEERNPKAPELTASFIAYKTSLALDVVKKMLIVGQNRNFYCLGNPEDDLGSWILYQPEHH